MGKILITGGTGLIGTHLQKTLISNNHEVVILTRSPKKENEFEWDIEKQYIHEKAFENVTHIIHLAGAGIADKRWTDKRKQEIINSRVATANLLFSYVKKLQLNLQGFIAASGIGYYGAITVDTIFTENDAPENDYISKVCIEWEKASNQFTQLGIPVTILRTGVVLSKKNGALAKMNTPLFLAILGNGKQYMPWIHINDLCALYCKAVDSSDFTGIFNAVAPDHQTNASFTKAISTITRKPVLPIPIPTFMLSLILGELSSILVKGSRVSATKTSSQYAFAYTNLTKALEDLLA